jgi:hypothetical protein
LVRRAYSGFKVLAEIGGVLAVEDDFEGR